MKNLNLKRHNFAAMAFLSLAMPGVVISTANATTPAPGEDLIAAGRTHSLCRRIVTRGGRLNVRKSPNGIVIGSLKNGTRVTIVNRGQNGWVPISAPMQGYVSSAYLKLCR